VYNTFSKNLIKEEYTVESTDGRIIKEIEDFLKKQRVAKDIRSPRCQYCLPFSSQCPEWWNACTNEKAEISNGLKCTFLYHQLECPYYKPDPNYAIFIQFKQLEERARNLDFQLELGQKRVLKELIKVTKALLKLSKRRRDLFGGWTYLYCRFQLMALEKELPWYRRMITKLAP